MLFGMAQPSENDHRIATPKPNSSHLPPQTSFHDSGVQVHLSQTNISCFLCSTHAQRGDRYRDEELEDMEFHGLVCMDHLGHVSNTRTIYNLIISRRMNVRSTYGSSTLSYTVGGNPSIIEHGEKKLSVSTLSEYGSVRVCNRGRSPVDYFCKNLHE
ncbi:hypothetical protein H4Q26_010969 [Puccinia striiformis f. sp. tritici PST-130]|nr:hypothetical protein H4Q26_010969 [Puccinia striiformis f. sp. tritici PST-130]